MKVYLDNAATTPIAPEVYKEMIPYLKDEFGNPSSAHAYGRKAKAVIETSRRKVAALINAHPSEIIFTSGGTEADNMAINCAIKDFKVERIITSKIEHHAVGHTVEDCSSNKDIELVFVRLDQKGHIDLSHLRELLKQSAKKTLVSLMHGNNEIGNLLPLDKVSLLCQENQALFHSDTVQTMGHYRFDMQKMNIDFVTCAAHKLHGPKGVGFLYMNKKLKGNPFIHGGSQERGMRGGTENLYGIVGLTKALEIAHEALEEHQVYVQELKSYMIKKLKEKVPNVNFHGDIRPEKSLYTILNVSLPETSKGGMLLFTLDLKGVACSGGSACTSGALQASHVLAGIKANIKRPNARFSFSRYTTKEEIDYAVDMIVEVYERNIGEEVGSWR